MGVDIARITAERAGDDCRIRVEGELEIDSVRALQDAVERALDTGERSLLIDVSPTTFIDSTGLAGLMAAVRDASLRGAAVRVLAPHGHEARLLIELTGTARVLGLTPD